MLDFIICAITNIVRVNLIYQFVEVFLGKTGGEKNKIFFVCAAYFTVNVAMFWLFHTAWINFVCNLAGISAVVGLHTRSIKENIFVTGSITLINIGCDAVAALSFISYEDGNEFSQIYELLTVLLILICWFLVGKIVAVHKNVEQAFRFSLVIVSFCSIAIILFLIYSGICEKIGIATTGIGLLVINFFMLYLHSQLLYTISQKFETKILEHKVEIYSNQLDVILQSEEKARALRHDMKHHINELRVLANKSGVEEIRHYVEQMEEFMYNPGEIVASGNVDIDSELNYILQKAREELTTVLIKVMLPEEIKHSFDINVLLGNLLENAIEAAKQSDQKYLSVDIALKRGVLKVQIENSFSYIDMLHKEDAGKMFLSTKRDKEKHGIGLKNVKKIIESHHGSMEIETNENIFCVRASIYISKIEND